MRPCFVGWCLLVPPLIAARIAGGQPPADSAQAAAHFSAGRWDAAATAYQALVRKDTANALNWLRLGTSLEELGRYDDAVSALRHALGAQPPLLHQVRYRLAKAYAGRGLGDSAIAVLAQAGAGGSRLWESVRDDADFAPLRADTRFAAALSRIERNRFPCRASPVNRQFDFWIGDWNVMSGTALLGTNLIQSVNEDCALQENWTSTGGGGGGKSWSFYDPSLRKWRQVFIFDSGFVWEYSGEWRDGAMRFTGRTFNPQNGQFMDQRMTFFPISKDSVRQLFENSTDGGKTWAPGFDGMYVRKSARQ